MKRVLTALLLVPAVFLVSFYAPPLIVWAVLALVALLCLREYFQIAAKLGFEPFSVAGFGAAAVLVLARGVPELAFLVVFGAILLALAMFRAGRLEKALGGAATTLFGVIYTAGPFALGRELHLASAHWLFYVLVLNWASDIAAFYAGRAFGRHKLAPVISPSKTWEGAIASALAAALAGSAYLIQFQPAEMTPIVAVLVSLTVNLAAQLGDLAESALKRGAQLKDSGELLPGHGGMLDRVDGLLFSLPACYLILMLLG